MPDFQRHSPVAYAAYADLLRSLADDTVSELRGTPTRVTRGHRVYWYDSYRIGNEVRKSYIGEDSVEMRDRIARHRDLAAKADARRKARARLVRLRSSMRRCARAHCVRRRENSAFRRWSTKPARRFASTRYRFVPASGAFSP